MVVLLGQSEAYPMKRSLAHFEAAARLSTRLGSSLPRSGMSVSISPGSAFLTLGGTSSPIEKSILGDGGEGTRQRGKLIEVQ